MVIAKGDRIGTLYLSPHNTDYSISVASTETGAALWHHRLGHMSDVRHIPAMKRNLISTRQLGDGGCLSTFGETWWKVTKGSMVIAKGNRIGTLFLCLDNTDYSIL